MKLIKILTAVLASWLLAIAPALATLTATVTPGYQYSASERPTVGTLNLLGFPTVLISGTVDGSTGLTAGSVAGNLLADSVPDGVTLNYNGGAPRQIQILPGGVSAMQINTNALGRGLTGGWAQGPASGTLLSVSVDGTTISFNTNNQITIPSGFLAGVFFTFPPTPNFTNTWGSTGAFLITNIAMTVPTNQWFYTTNVWNTFVTIVTNSTAQTIADNDTMALQSTLQTTNTSTTMRTLAQYVGRRLQGGVGGGVYTNLHRVTAFTWCGNTTNGNNAAAGTLPFPLYLNTNLDYSELVDISGSWTGASGGQYTTYVADQNTNSVFQIDSSTTSAAIDRNRFIIPPHYGIYIVHVSGSTPVSWSLNILHVPY